MIDLANVPTGLKGSADLVVGVEHTAPSIGSGLVPVLATPAMINLIAAAALGARGIDRGPYPHALVSSRGERREGADRQWLASAGRRQCRPVRCPCAEETD